ncbi:MAG: phosphoribosyltransferase [Nitriliruptor sp.]|nr:MAG: phosphoribosyltransferase [Nitriliruptor sp.]
MRFTDRVDAGERLAAVLDAYAGEDVVVLALPRGGVPVATEVARALKAPLDVIGVRKLGAPSQPEFGIGAIAEGGIRVVDDDSASAAGLDKEAISALEQRERKELQRRVQEYRGDRGLPELTGKTVIVVDDGLATGVTARAACRAVRSHDPARLVLAVPVAPPRSVEALRSEADDVVVVHTPASLMSVGGWYDVFDQISDDEVRRLLEETRSAQGRTAP